MPPDVTLNDPSVSGSSQRARWVATGLLILYVLLYVASNGVEFQWAGYFRSLYWAKHAVVVLAALCALLYPSCLLSHTRDVLIIVTLYTFCLAVASQSLTIALHSGAFFLGCSFLALAFRRAHALLPVLLFVIVLIPPVANLSLHDGNFIYNTYYGRPRLLLGYFHPKEAANAVTACGLIALATFHRRAATASWIFVICVMALVFFIQTRNTLLFLVLFFVMNRLYLRFKAKTVVLILLGGFALFWLGWLTFDYAVYNELSSERLVLWTDALTNPERYPATPFGDVSFLSYQQGLDNYYLATYLESGIPGVAIVLAFCFCIATLANARHNQGIYAQPLLFALFVNALFDAGLHGTGNILHIVAWSMALATWHTRVDVPNAMQVPVQPFQLAGRLS